jgi:beta-galactosidase
VSTNRTSNNQKGYFNHREHRHHGCLSLFFIGKPLICFSALHFTIEDLTGEKRGSLHLTDLKARDFVALNIDYKQTGVGGNDSWGARPLPEYTLFPKEYSYAFCLKPFSRGDDPMKLSKKSPRINTNL